MIKTISNCLLLFCLMTLIACQNSHTTTDLIQAINKRDTKIALQIINSDINLDTPDSLGMSAIHWSAKEPYPM